MKSKALFLDRDGVINKEIHYLHKKEKFIFVDGIFKLCKNFKDRGFLIFVITNQAGIARRYYSEDDFINLTKWMINEFEKRNISIAKVYFCPHHPEFTGVCECRKPNPGMINLAKKEFNIDLNDSVLIGDRISDIEAGKNAGVGLNILISPNRIQNINDLMTSFL